MNKEIRQFLKELSVKTTTGSGFRQTRTASMSCTKRFIDEVQGSNQPDCPVRSGQVAGLESKGLPVPYLPRSAFLAGQDTFYKVHFAAYMAQGGRASERGGYYIHLEPVPVCCRWRMVSSA